MKKKWNLLLLLFFGCGIACFAETVDFGKTPLRISNPRDVNAQCKVGNIPGETKEGTILTWEATHRPFSIFEMAAAGKSAALTTLEKTEIVLTLYVAENTRIQLASLRFLDASGECFQFRSALFPLRTGQAGVQQIRYRLDPGRKYESWGGNHDGKLDWPLRFQGIGFELLPGSGELIFLTLEITTRDDELAAIQVDVDTGHPVRLIRPGETVEPTVTFRNNGKEEKQFAAKLFLENFQGEKTAPVHYDFTLAPGGEVTRQLKFAEDQVGIWYVNYTLSQPGDQSKLSGRRSFIRMEPAGPAPYREGNFRFGVCSHPERAPEDQQRLEALAAGLIGVNFLRLDAEWGSIQTNSAKNWNIAKFDRLVEIFGKQQIELMPLIGFTPWWAVARDWKPFYPDSKRYPRPDYDAFAAWAEKLAAHTRGKIRYFEVWNEPELGFANFSTEEYIELQKYGYRGVKKGNPDATVSTAGFTYFFAEDRPPKPGLMRRALTEGRGSYDLIGFHGHQSFQGYRDQVLPMKEMFRKQKITVPWMPNETGLTSVGDAEPEQVVALFQKLMFSWAEGAVGYNWYDLRNDGFKPLDREHNFGMLTRDFYPKAVYVAYNTIVHYFRDARFVRALPLDGGIYAYLFKTSSGMLIACWREPGSNPALTVVRTDASEAKEVDLMGNTRPLSLENGRILLNPELRPAIFSFPGASQLEAEAKLIEVTGGNLAVPGRKTMLQLVLFNPFSDTREFTVSGGGQSVRATLAGNEHRSVQLPVDGVADSMELACTAGKGVSARFRIPLREAKLISSRPHDTADFRLDKAGQRQELYPANPLMKHMHWKGAEDCSADIRLWIAGDRLVVEADVTDDVHCQPETGEKVWEGDNVQMAFLAPGDVGYWEIGLTRLADGSPELFVWKSPDGRNGTELVKNSVLKTERRGTLTRYHAEFPFPVFGITRKTLKQGVLFGLLVNDNDGNGRKGWMQVAPGLGDRKDISSLPTVVID